VTLENLIKVTLFVSDMSEIEQLRETLFNVYAKHIPASSLIEINSLFCKDLKIEIEAIIALEG
jgi:2-iminobutanoate/2-iminopropanoate deaminase